MTAHRKLIFNYIQSCCDKGHRQALVMLALEVIGEEFNCLEFLHSGCRTTCVIILALALPALSSGPDPGPASLISWQTLKYSVDVFQTNISHLEN